MKYTIPLHIFFHYTCIWKEISVGGLYTSLFCAIIPTLFPYFLLFWYPYILLHFQMFFITCSIMSACARASSSVATRPRPRHVMTKYWWNLIWRCIHNPPNCQIKFTAKFSGHTGMVFFLLVTSEACGRLLAV